MRTMNALVVGLPLMAFGFGNNVKVNFHVCDEEGHAITNAVIRTVTQRDRLAPSERGGAPTAMVVPPRSEGYPPPERGGKSVGTQKEIGSEVGSDRTDAKISFERPTQDGVTPLQAYAADQVPAEDFLTTAKADAFRRSAGGRLTGYPLRANCAIIRDSADSHEEVPRGPGWEHG